ncbi:SWIM zinc finger family protein [Amycolatopsis jiangsuensis]|uniref:Putative Zn finger protein/transposase-like protein n=1 Tax=Amycolatopsis jiangsuensis TaxID=1181879 RepID=A0A840ITL1_9PSEU|nr:SWIM zinc finger family protein [Amycolatopsis jiangsuensis]MBB4684879.1 putative Zn finger protein/transposase-like protein [Amycolatopsis jiangsuensis]
MPPRRTFGRTWWGRAWVEALEQRARLDPNRLPHGRTYARKDTVRQLEVAPGKITARVRGSRPEPYRVTIRMREFSPREWDTLLDVAGRRMGHAAALLDGELPEELAAQSREAGADLLPGPGDLRPRCSCPDSANPCKHVAAVYYLVADAVDADPFVLFTLHGRPREEVLSRLRELRAPGVTKPARPPDPGLTPKKAYARRVAAVPPRPVVPDEPGPPAVLDLDPPARTGWTSAGLTTLAADAASLAWEMLRGVPADLTFEEDLARRAARPSAAIPELAAAAGIAPADLTAWAHAWREAGRGGLAALREPWTPGPGPLAQARADLAELGETRVWRNRVTAGPLQLRYGRDHRWYRFVRTAGGWWLDGPSAERPVELAYPAS